MWSFSTLFSSHSLCFLCFFCSVIVAAPGDIVNKTCKKCADDSPIFDFNLCTTSLQAVPVSRATNLQGLGIIAMELALENATSTIERIDTMLNSTGTFDPNSVACLKDCLELYSDAAKTLVFSIGAFMSGDYQIAGMWVRAVMEVATTCDESFARKGGEDSSPLVVENHNLFQLSDIALCITQRLGVPAYF